LLGTVLSSQPSLAVTLATHVLTHGASTSASCRVTNIGQSEIQVRVRIFRADTLKTDFVISLAPDQTNGFSAPVGAGQDRCLFSSAASKRQLRAALLVHNSSGDTFESAEAH
jgi:hypothetical protein